MLQRLSLCDVVTKSKATLKKPAAAKADALHHAAAPAAANAVVTKDKKRPCFSVERTRSQVMGRTGQGGPGSSKAFKYGKGQAYPNEAAAVKAAELWVESELK